MDFYRGNGIASACATSNINAKAQILETAMGRDKDRRDGDEGRTNRKLDSRYFS